MSADVEQLQRENAEYQALFELQWKRMAKATERWRAEDPEARALIQPDLGDLLQWLMDDADRARAGGRPQMPITDDALSERIDSALAVDRALNAAERAAFFEYRLVGQYDGAQPADWIAEAQNADVFVEHTDPWMEQHGDRVTAYLMALHELPKTLTRRLLSAALYATFGISSATLGHQDHAAGERRRRTHVEIASGAALWARGYAEALGWTPQNSV